MRIYLIRSGASQPRLSEPLRELAQRLVSSIPNAKSASKRNTGRSNRRQSRRTRYTSTKGTSRPRLCCQARDCIASGQTRTLSDSYLRTNTFEMHQYGRDTHSNVIDTRNGSRPGRA